MPARPGETLALWEALASTTSVARGASVLVALGAADGLADAVRMPLATAARAALGELRERAGPQVQTVLTCPDCGAVLDVPLVLDDLLVATDGLSEGAAASRVTVDGVVVRGPTTEDLLVALASPEPSAALRDRCVTWPAGIDATTLDPAVRDRALAAAEELAGASALAVRLDCPDCGGDVTAEVDAVALLAERVADEVRDLLSDVAELAMAFGWSEDDVLRLSDARRRAYLGLARAGGAR
ncbi:hypothetical protein [Humibacillus xanthopallidus]|uniref:Uncharacterized protein n=1 Tax=Humibacillus xanthopallidus TaxID=412689 RepID=A0A543I2Y1_9MICO|nr:hypothetical protein [Humibacillus xanthopallidus]TQM64954.1 hypothetical protein FBY41_1336 [Humibacillus xanthopallidus]